MKTILLIGLGRFGRHVAMKLHELNHQVMAVDQDEEKVNRILPYVTSAQIGDSTNEEFLASLGVRNFDVCIVAIGDNFQSSLETASLLKEAGRKGGGPGRTGHSGQIPAAKRGGRGRLPRAADRGLDRHPIQLG